MKSIEPPSPATESLAAAIYEALLQPGERGLVASALSISKAGGAWPEALLSDLQRAAFLRVAAKIAEAHLAILSGGPDVAMERIIFEALGTPERGVLPLLDVEMPCEWDMLHELDRERFRKVAGAASMAFLRATARAAKELPSPVETLAVLALSTLIAGARGKLLREARDLLELAELAPADGEKADALVDRIDAELQDDAPIATRRARDREEGA